MSCLIVMRTASGSSCVRRFPFVLAIRVKTMTQITLTETEGELLHTLSQCTGKTEEALLREALDLLAARVAAQDRLAAFRQARGMWKDRDDLPSLTELRADFDRFGHNPRGT